MIVPYLPKDLNEIRLSDEHRTLALAHGKKLEVLARYDLARTIYSRDGRDVVAILGAMVPVPGFSRECEVFIFPSTRLKDHAVTFWRDLKRELARVCSEFDVVTTLSTESPERCAFFERLGFDQGGMDRGFLRWVIAR